MKELLYYVSDQLKDLDQKPVVFEQEYFPEEELIYEDLPYTVEKEDFGFDVSVKAADFSLNSLKTPKIDKSDRDDDPDALFLEKVFLIETAVTLLDCLYRQFLGLRLDEGKWKKTTGEMMKWMKEAF